MPLRAFVLLLLLPAFQPGGAAIRNGGFEEGDTGNVPPGWTMPPPSVSAGYRVTLTDEDPKSGARALLLSRDPAENAAGFGTVIQRVEGTSFRNRRVTLRAHVRVAPGSRAQLWMRVDRAGGATGFFDNMGDRPVTSAAWSEYRIEGNVDDDAVAIFVGLILTGAGKAWLDDVSIESVVLTLRPAEPPRAFAGRGLDNVVAFARLLGYVRYFHPSDQAAKTDWDGFAIQGVGAVESAPSPAALARLLEERFREVAPTVGVFTGAKPPAPPALQPSPSTRRRVVMWRHRGVGLRGGNVYSSERVTREVTGAQLPEGFADPDQPLVVDLGAGVKAAVPLAVWSDGTATLPRGEAPTSAPVATSAADRGTRLAAVALAWNVFQHFYPYFDVVQVDWPASLRTALASAAEDTDTTFDITLRKLLADLHDGHGRVNTPGSAPRGVLPLAWDWIEGEVVITEVGPGDVALRRGDLVRAIDGRPIAEALAAEERLISSATPQWRRYRALNELLAGPLGEKRLSVVSDGVARDVRIRTQGTPVVESRPDKIAEIRPGIFYVDPARLTDEEFVAALPRLEKASGLVFEMRGYPRLSPIFIRHLIASPVASAQWLVPVVTRPDRQGVTWDANGRWNLFPAAPRLGAPAVFITDGRAISYAESCMGIVEHYRLGEIVGAPTAGTNGNVNPFTVPGGYTLTWTGMKVLKHDGSPHHGVGIQPTVPVSRTINGARDGRDEMLERAIEVVQRKRGS